MAATLVLDWSRSAHQHRHPHQYPAFQRSPKTRIANCQRHETFRTVLYCFGLQWIVPLRWEGLTQIAVIGDWLIRLRGDWQRPVVVVVFEELYAVVGAVVVVIGIFLMETIARDACYCQEWQLFSPCRLHYFYHSIPYCAMN